MSDTSHMMLRKEPNQRTGAETHGAERGLNRFEGFSDAVFAIALTLLIVEIKVPGSPEGPHGYSDLVSAMAEQWREFLALLLCYVVIGAYWLRIIIPAGFTRRAITGSARSTSCSCWPSWSSLIRSASGAFTSAPVSRPSHR